MINIIYRVCETNASFTGAFRPSWYSKEKCLKSFLKSVEFSKNHIGKVVFVHDGPRGKLFDQIPKEFEIFKIDENSAPKSYDITLDIGKDIGGNIYFTEDDYLHKPESIAKIDMVLPELKLVTGYDHPSKYTSQYDYFNFTVIKKNIFDTASNMNWQTSKFCCLTYAIEESTYKKVQPIIKNKSLDDIGLFVELNNRGIPLWASTPGLTTQVDSYLSPDVNWEEFNNML